MKGQMREKAHRNGTGNRKLNTTEGTLELNRLQIREFPFETMGFEKYARVQKTFSSMMLESYLNGVSTHNVMNVVI